MTSRNNLRAAIAALCATGSLSANLVWAQTPEQTPAEEDMGIITVTGSRTITDNTQSPTPLTTVDIGDLLLTTPSDTADALNKLPTILGGRTPRTQGNGSTNNGGNTLSLRNFGPSRTLVLMDGHRIVPNNQDGTVNIDVLPSMLMERVDLVTGGASAIYGSDAVAGVVNYVLNKEFTGLTVKGDYGLSNYGDGDQYQVGAAWGTELFSDRGHFEVAARFRHQDMIPMSERPYAEDGQAWLLTGAGTLANPFRNTPYGRVITQASHGNVNCGTACTVNGYTFNQAGVLTPLVHGAPVQGSTSLESGGDGGYVKYGTFRSEIEMKDVFARFDVDVGESANWYVQGSWAQAENASDWINWVVSTANGRPSAIFANNPFLTAATQALVGANITCPAAGWRCLPPPALSPQTGSTPPPPPNTPYLSVPSYIWNSVDGQPANGNPNRMYRTLGDQKSWSAETGATGELGSWNWDVYYTHGNSELTVTNPNNTDNAKYLASLDAVLDGGTIKCWVTTQPQFASLYPGCVPTNITDPAGPSAAAYDYLRTKTAWTLTQELDDVGFSIGGALFGLGFPAGEITANFSGEARWATYVMESNAFPTDFVNCTGLRMCLQGGGAPVRWVQNTNAEVDAEQHVYEGALEFNVPLLKDVTGFQELSTNLAGRWTKYSEFDAVESWKVGLNWRVNETLRFRSTLSSDIRAPNLNDLFQPAGVSSTGFRDLLTNVTSNTRLISRGNPNLTPEEAKTFTAGIVLTPSAIPRFSVSVDFYETKLTNAITQITYQNDAIQGLCVGSRPAYDSPFCELAIRPIMDPSNPGYTLAANYPTEILNSPFNAAVQKIKGYDFELDYSWDMWGGAFTFRHLATYQPTNSTLNTPASLWYTWAVQPDLLQSTFITYENSGWSVALQNRWLSNVTLESSSNNLNDGQNGVTGGTQNYVDETLDAYDVVDITIGKQFEFGDSNVEAYLTVNNVLDERAPLFPSNSGLPGLFYPTMGFYDDMGRFYTAGFRMKF
ncbi:MAG TPA: TonB-dependent receptor [Steroidobacteraceae bacterium]|nr:TonB-dependent receptor [Steroidobacteraceae bacterium]